VYPVPRSSRNRTRRRVCRAERIRAARAGAEDWPRSSR
jgi:hypothetical protein